MKYVHSIPRWILGLIYFVFGLWGALMAFGILAMPPQEAMSPKATAFTMGIFGSGYFFQLLKITETVGGLLLLINKCTPFALVILAPITINIFCFHIFLTGPSQWALPIFMVIVHAYLGYQYKNVFKPLFQ